VDSMIAYATKRGRTMNFFFAGFNILNRQLTKTLRGT